MKRIKKPAMLCVAMLLCFFSIVSAQTVVYAANPVQVKIGVEQLLEQTGSGTGANDTFCYKLRPLQPANPMPAASTCAINGSSSSELGPITFTQTAVYEYELTLDQSPPGTEYLCDTQVYTISIHVRQSGNDLVPETVVRNANGDKVDKALYTHKYRAAATDPAVMSYPPVKLTVEGNPGRPSTFSFVLTAKDPLSPMPAGSKDGVKTVSITGSGEASFGAWSYTEAGVYYYTVTQINTGIDGYTYDLSVYTITDTVTEADGQLVLNRVVTNSAGKTVQTCIYINQYEEPVVGGKTPNNGNGANGNGASPAGKGPKTGDDTNISALITRITLSCLAAMGCVRYLLIGTKRRKNREVTL